MLLHICYFAIFFKFPKIYVQTFNKMKSDKIKEFAANVHFLFTFFIQKRRENSNRIKLWIWWFVRNLLKLVSLYPNFHYIKITNYVQWLLNYLVDLLLLGWTTPEEPNSPSKLFIKQINDISHCQIAMVVAQFLTNFVLYF